MTKTRETQSPNKIPAFFWAVVLILAVLVLAVPFFGSRDSGNSQGANQEKTTTSSGTGSVPATTQPTTTELGKGKLSIKILSEGTEEAVSGATVAILGVENLELVTGTLGEVEFYRITEGTYFVRVSANGFFGQEVSAEVSPERETELAIHLRKSAPEPVAPEAEPLPNSGFSEVRVIDASSRSPIAGATVHITDSIGRPVLTKDTIENGTALFNLPVGGYFATINAEGYYEKKANFVIYENSTVPVLVGIGRRI